MAHGKPHDLRLPLGAEPHYGSLGFALDSLDERNHCIQLVNVVIELGFTGGELLGETLGRSMVAHLDHFDGLVGTVTTASHTCEVAPSGKRLVTMLFFPFGDKSGISLCVPFVIWADCPRLAVPVSGPPAVHGAVDEHGRDSVLSCLGN